jgi:hypothetical protein
MCSFKNHYDEASKILFHTLRTRGYNYRMLRKAQHDVWHNHTHKTDTPNNKDKLHIIIPYSSLISSKLIHELRNIISENEYFSTFRTVAAYTKHRRLKNMLTTSDSDSYPTTDTHNPHPLP